MFHQFQRENRLLVLLTVVLVAVCFWVFFLIKHLCTLRKIICLILRITFKEKKKKFDPHRFLVGIKIISDVKAFKSLNLD